MLSNKKLYINRILATIILYHVNLSAISMVYNFQVHEITKQDFNLHSNIKSNMNRGLFTTLPFIQFRKKGNDSLQSFEGGLGTGILRIKKRNYIRVDFGFSHLKDNINHYHTTESDDILLTGGSNIMLSKNSKIGIHGAFGIPTHANYALQNLEIGYGQYGIGVQIDGIHRKYNLDEDYIDGILYGGRYIYFIPRKAKDLECKTYEFSINNMIDLILAYKKDFPKHGLEIGYNLRFRFGAKINSNIKSLVAITKEYNYTRNSFYGAYKYRFSINNINNRALLSFSYGFDDRHKDYGNKYILMVWGAWTIYF